MRYDSQTSSMVPVDGFGVASPPPPNTTELFALADARFLAGQGGNPEAASLPGTQVLDIGALAVASVPLSHQVVQLTLCSQGLQSLGHALLSSMMSTCAHCQFYCPSPAVPLRWVFCCVISASCCRASLRLWALARIFCLWQTLLVRPDRPSSPLTASWWS